MKKKQKLKLYLISINYIYKMKKIISYIYKKCWDIIANPTGYITICDSLLWFCYVSIEATVTLRSAYFLRNCFRKFTMILSISSTAASVSFLCLLLLKIYL